MTDNTEKELAILRKVESEFEKYKGEAYTLLGRLEAFNFSKRFLEFSELKTIERIKETKAYKDLWVTDKKTGEKKKINTLKEYCECLGLSYDTVNNHLNYLQNLGEPLYRESQRLGVSNREMRRLIKLPTEAITEISKQDYSEDDDKTRLLATLSEYELTIEKQAEALKETAQKLEESQQNYEALSRVNENKDKRINSLDLELQKSKNFIETATPEEYGEALQNEVSRITFAIFAKIRTELRPAFEKLYEHQGKENILHTGVMGGFLAAIYNEIYELKKTYGLEFPDVFDQDMPAWARVEKEEYKFLFPDEFPEEFEND